MKGKALIGRSNVCRHISWSPYAIWDHLGRVFQRGTVKIRLDWLEGASQWSPWFYWFLWEGQSIMGGTISWEWVLICVNTEKAVSRNRHTCVQFFLLLTADVVWQVVLNPSCFDFSMMMEFNLEFFKNKISPCLPKVAFCQDVLSQQPKWS